MEVIALAIILGMGSEINKNADRIELLEDQTALQQKWIEDLENHTNDLENTLIVLAAKHSSLNANYILSRDKTKEAIEAIVAKIEQLEPAE